MSGRLFASLCRLNVGLSTVLAWQMRLFGMTAAGDRMRRNAVGWRAYADRAS